MSESQLQSALLLAAPSEIPTLRMFRRNIGVVQHGSRTVKHGIAGQGDIWGVWRGTSERPSVHLEIELKAATGRLSVEQVLWQQFCGTWGIPHVVLKAEKSETVEQTVSRWCEELRAMTPA